MFSSFTDSGPGLTIKIKSVISEMEYVFKAFIPIEGNNVTLRMVGGETYFYGKLNEGISEIIFDEPQTFSGYELGTSKTITKLSISRDNKLRIKDYREI